MRSTRTRPAPRLRGSARDERWRVVLILGFLAACTDGDGDLGADAGLDPDAAVTLTATRYPPAAIRSPVTAAVAARLEAIAAAGAGTTSDDVFAKVGDSHTASTNLLHCFADNAGSPYVIELDGRDALAPTLTRFRAGSIGGTTPFDRISAAAAIGRGARWALTGTPSPLAQELAATTPAFAFVAYGSNDMELGSTHASALPGFWDAMNELLDQLAAAGAVSVVVGLPPRTDSATAARWISTYDAVTRALAERRQLPYVSMWIATRGLPAQGLGVDGLHHNTFVTGGRTQPCLLTAAGLDFGNNQRNLHYLDALAAATAAVDGEPPDAEVLPPVAGVGTAADPFEIDLLPFTHSFDTSAGERLRDDYPGCGTGQNEGGPEIVYRLTLPAAAAIRVIALDGAGTDVDVHVLDPSASCVERADRLVDRTLPAGDVTIVVDTFVMAGLEQAGPYSLVVLGCEAGDPDCAVGP